MIHIDTVSPIHIVQLILYLYYTLTILFLHFYSCQLIFEVL